MPRAGPHLDRLVAVFERLRAPGGCPWDRERSLGDLGKHLLEECEEAVTEIRRLTRRRGDPEALREELGDLLCNLVFTVQIARERGWFGMEEVARGAVDKIVRRHPHVFGGAKAGTAEEVEALWANIKARERAGRRRGAARASGRSARSRRSRRS
ncbi:MAG TPA: MazG nucleotide pyrophosphohydrolase domain-containing protein [Planctomycetota bacterium]|nr:MazG nucleotide pyrophosphohydrolase domain-containing protein [Planctomycetota bacterium]